MKVINGKPKRRKRSIILRIALLAFAVYIVVSIVNQQIQIGQKKQELSTVSQQLNAQNLKNEELKTALETGTTDSDEFIQRKAREELNYVKPNERVFVNIAGD
ncbi:MAG: septum formation initiator family protein [Clostridiales bacterium]|nr:septum formation initiator family protein [Clostridiales bacterium]